MHHHAIEHVVGERTSERRRAADLHRLVSGARRSRADREAAAPPATARTRDLAVDLASVGLDAVGHEPVVARDRQAPTSRAAA